MPALVGTLPHMHSQQSCCQLTVLKVLKPHASARTQASSVGGCTIHDPDGLEC